MRGFCLEVWGDLACFTRPEMKVERVSYDLITPSAARGVFEAILWKPAIRWRVRRIDALAPRRWTSVRRNEVKVVATPSNDGIFVEDERTQRAGILLRDVRYRIHAEFDFIPVKDRPRVFNPLPESWREMEEAGLPEVWRRVPGSDEKPEKYAAMFDRRSRKGQTFNQPYLGCREFACRFRRVEDVGAPIPAEVKTDAWKRDWAGERDLGYMLYDLDFANPGEIRPLFFRARIVDGVMMITDRDSGEVLG